MQQLRSHIAGVLLLNFVLPQLLGSLHYILVAHELPYEQEEVYITAELSIQDHSCHYHLQSPPPLSSKEERDERILPGYFPPQPVSGGLQNYIQQPDYHFRLRGPPEDRTFEIYKAIQP